MEPSVQAQVWAALRDPSKDMPIPAGSETLEQINEMPVDRLRANPWVSVIGCVSDWQQPISTRGEDWKTTVEIKDGSLWGSNGGMTLSIFQPQNRISQIPAVENVSDVLILRDVKVQMFRGQVSLLWNKTSQLHMLYASKAKNTPLGTTVPLRNWLSYPKIGNKVPSEHESAYSLNILRKAESLELPTNEEFKKKVNDAAVVKGEKFSLIRDVKVGSFHDILGNVIHVFHQGNGITTLYVTDYTEHHLLYNYTLDDDQAPGVQDGDEYGYITSKPKAPKDWPGPLGKMTIQLTLFDEHASYAKDSDIKPDHWVSLKNVQFRIGKNGSYMEGAIRGNRNLNSRIGVEIVEHREPQVEHADHYIEAIKRKRDWRNKKIKESREGKRTPPGEKSEPRTKRNNKNKTEMKWNTNKNIRCRHMDIPAVPLREVLLPRFLSAQASDGSRHLAPFTNEKSRAEVRVVDFYPNKIEDFTVGHPITEFSILSDYDSEDDMLTEEYLSTTKGGKYFTGWKWDFRFRLLLEDAGPGSSKERIWVLVDDKTAQELLNLDAKSLRTNKDLLQSIKTKMFLLWGDLEEIKTASLTPEGPADPVPTSPIEPPSSPPMLLAGRQPDLESDNEASAPSVKKMKRSIENENASNTGDTSGPHLSQQKKKRRLINGNGAPSTGEASMNSPVLRTNSLPFSCCLAQYGIKVDEPDPLKMNAGEGKRWQRMFKMFGVKILHD